MLKVKLWSTAKQKIYLTKTTDKSVCRIKNIAELFVKKVSLFLLKSIKIVRLNKTSIVHLLFNK